MTIKDLSLREVALLAPLVVVDHRDGRLSQAGVRRHQRLGGASDPAAQGGAGV